jgi:thiamine biosynthesis protein ThiF, family 2
MPTIETITSLLKNKTVGIAGAGGLGSNCAMALARTGVGHLIIVDFDLVAASNLNRQYYFIDQIGKPKVVALKENILRANPETQITIYQAMVCKENIVHLFSGCDVLVEAFDAAEIKQMLIEQASTLLPNLPVVAGSGMAGWGNTNKLKVECFDNVYICGDGTEEASEINPPLGPRVGIVACMEANTVLELLLKNITNENNPKQ